MTFWMLLSGTDLSNVCYFILQCMSNLFIPIQLRLDESGFSFKDGEPDLLMRRILTEQIKVCVSFKDLTFKNITLL